MSPEWMEVLGYIQTIHQLPPQHFKPLLGFFPIGLQQILNDSIVSEEVYRPGLQHELYCEEDTKETGYALENVRAFCSLESDYFMAVPKYDDGGKQEVTQDGVEGFEKKVRFDTNDGDHWMLTELIRWRVQTRVVVNTGRRIKIGWLADQAANQSAKGLFNHSTDVKAESLKPQTTMI
ncbi:hypothetical protein L218DRAFT_949595 [Marasmius fiardii PR-910]|nr:hypothetical protein L218DRAFT_949595 [Marasmius fiardii PR-910]